MFVDKERSTQLDELRNLAVAERAILIDKIRQFGAAHEKVSDDAEDITVELEQSPIFAWRQPYEDEHIIGYSARAGFVWNGDNGFSSMKEVERFLSDHPGFVIQNEYGDIISLPDFRDTVKNG